MIFRGVEISIAGCTGEMVCALGGGHLHTPYISFKQLLLGGTATTYTVLWERSYGSHFTMKHTTIQPYSAVAPYGRWGRRGVLEISSESYRRFGPLLLRRYPVSCSTKQPFQHPRAPL